MFVWESENYFVFSTTDNAGNRVLNNHTFVVNKRTRKGEWLPISAFPISDAGEFVRAHEIH